MRTRSTLRSATIVRSTEKAHLIECRYVGKNKAGDDVDGVATVWFPKSVIDRECDLLYVRGDGSNALLIEKECELARRYNLALCSLIDTEDDE